MNEMSEDHRKVLKNLEAKKPKLAMSLKKAIAYTDSLRARNDVAEQKFAKLKKRSVE